MSTVQQSTLAAILQGRTETRREVLTSWIRSRTLGNTWPVVAGLLAVVALFAVQPLIEPSTQRFLATVFMFVALAQAWNIIGGYTGYASFGQVVFFGIGAYTTAVLMNNYHVSFWIAMPASIVAGVLFATLIGLPLLRLRGHYFAIATLGAAEGAREVINNMTPITGGGGGITIPTFGDQVPTPYFGKPGFYIAFLAVAAVSLALAALLARSRFGYAMVAVHEDEDAAGAIGINTTRVKVVAFAVSGAIVAAAGAFYAFQQIEFYPTDVFDANFTVLMVIMVVIGGSGTIIGPLAGAVGLELLAQFLRVNFGSFNQLIFGAIIVLVVVFFPQGVVNYFRDAWRTRNFSILDNIRRYLL
ncbi:MAG TPA: branched-chain amino acid ABC transporter permease [Candidatus Dormibacteraeota bacterium]|nr:branched-chain amino acid ABC transporter permease [Candidatus Dormibacteraeota bacterium]